MQHEQAYDILEEYVMGTLSPSDRVAVEEHLDSHCEECLVRLAELGEVAVRLADTIPREEPPPELKGKIMASLAPAASDRQTDTVSKRGSNVVRILAVVATAAAIVLAVRVWILSGDMAGMKDQLAQSETKITRLEKEIEAYMDATSLLASPGMQFIDLAGVAPNEQAFGKVVLEPDSGQAVVYMYELPPAPEGMIYQLWMIRDGVPTSVGTFTVNDDGSAKLMLDPMPDMGSLASFDVTIEPAGGVPKPTGMMYLTSPGVLQSHESE
jgi:anti-sigma-K factor RskA